MEQTPQLPDNCEHCGSADLHEELIHSAFWHQDRLVVVEGIPALVCRGCSEQFYDDATVMQIDLMRGEGFPLEQAQQELRVPVFSFRDRVRRNEEK